MHGTSQSGACPTCRKRVEARCPRSAGFSSRYSHPASRAARNKLVAVRRTSSLACCSSRACCGGMSGSPATYSRSRTGGGPPSEDAGDEKKSEMEKVGHGGEATTATKAPVEQRSSRR
eukprot:3703763-Pleurochrysis_carterae.AAC.1